MEGEGEAKLGEVKQGGRWRAEREVTSSRLGVEVRRMCCGEEEEEGSGDLTSADTLNMDQCQNTHRNNTIFVVAQAGASVVIIAVVLTTEI